MSKPELTDITSGQQGWDSTLNDNLAILRDGPLPIKSYANRAGLPAAGSNDECIAWVQDEERLYQSDGTNWWPLGLVADTAELIAGYDQINDKTIYKKTFSFLLANAGAATQAHGIGTEDLAEGSFWKIEGVAQDGSEVRMLPWYDGTDHLEVKVDTTNITVTSTKDESSTTAVVTLYYTKT